MACAINVWGNVKWVQWTCSFKHETLKKENGSESENENESESEKDNKIKSSKQSFTSSHYTHNNF